MVLIMVLIGIDPYPYTVMCGSLYGPDFVSGSFWVPDATPIGTAIESLRCKGRIQEFHNP